VFFAFLVSIDVELITEATGKDSEEIGQVFTEKT